ATGEGAGRGTGSEQEERPAPQVTTQTQRYLKVRNQTGQRLTVYVQFRAPTDQGQEAWYPAAPGASAGPLKFELEAGAGGGRGGGGGLGYGAAPIRPGRARLWAESASGQWLKYKDQDVVLVPQPYRADTLGTHTHTFNR